MAVTIRKIFGSNKNLCVWAFEFVKLECDVRFFKFNMVDQF